MTLRTDLRLTVRALRTHAGYALAAVGTLALGIGATTAMFSAVYAVLLAPQPIREPSRLVAGWGLAPELSHGLIELTYRDIEALGRDSRTVRSMAAVGSTTWSAVLEGRGDPARLAYAGVSGTFFETVGVPAALGRALLPADDVRGGANVLVLSHAAWRDRFGSDPAIVGRTITLDGQPQTVVGGDAGRLRLPARRRVLDAAGAGALGRRRDLEDRRPRHRRRVVLRGAVARRRERRHGRRRALGDRTPPRRAPARATSGHACDGDAVRGARRRSGTARPLGAARRRGRAAAHRLRQRLGIDAHPRRPGSPRTRDPAGSRRLGRRHRAAVAGRVGGGRGARRRRRPAAGIGTHVDHAGARTGGHPAARRRAAQPAGGGGGVPGHARGSDRLRPGADAAGGRHERGRRLVRCRTAYGRSAAPSLAHGVAGGADRDGGRAAGDRRPRDPQLPGAAGDRPRLPAGARPLAAGRPAPRGSDDGEHVDRAAARRAGRAPGGGERGRRGPSSAGARRDRSGHDRRARGPAGDARGGGVQSPPQLSGGHARLLRCDAHPARRRTPLHRRRPRRQRAGGDRRRRDGRAAVARDVRPSVSACAPRRSTAARARRSRRGDVWWEWWPTSAIGDSTRCHWTSTTRTRSRASAPPTS